MGSATNVRLTQQAPIIAFSLWGDCEKGIELKMFNKESA
jgi:hypothetical protein